MIGLQENYKYSPSIIFNILTHSLFRSQYLKTRRRGLPAFRRLLGRPILQNIALQDVVFAGDSGEFVDAVSAADRACAKKTSDLDATEKQLQKYEMESVREGVMLTTTERNGREREWRCYGDNYGMSGSGGVMVTTAE